MSNSVAPSSIYLVDDHPLVREALALRLTSKEGVSVCGQEGLAVRAQRDILDSKPDLVIVDFNLPDKSGLELMADVHASNPEILFLFFSMFDELIYAERIIRAGGRGYLMKDSSSADLIDAVGKVLGGGVYLSPNATRRMVEQISRDGGADGNPIDQLSNRELEVFHAIGDGKNTKRIADDLNLSPKTIETHRERIKAKLGVSDMTQLLKYAIHFAAHPGGMGRSAEQSS